MQLAKSTGVHLAQGRARRDPTTLRQDRLLEGHSLENLLWEINTLTKDFQTSPYDHVTIWKVGRERKIDCEEDPGVAVIALTNDISIATTGDDRSKAIPKDHLVITPETELTSGKWLEIRTGPRGGSWIEIRQSTRMQSTVCKQGLNCTRNKCGLSNHELNRA
jgi:hypothetical protein